MKGVEADVRKLLAYEASYKHSNKDLPSGDVEEDFIVSIISKAWTNRCYKLAEGEKKKKPRMQTTAVTMVGQIQILRYRRC